MLEDVGCNWGVRPRWLLGQGRKEPTSLPRKNFTGKKNFGQTVTVSAAFSCQPLLLGKDLLSLRRPGAGQHPQLRVPFLGGAPGVALPEAEVSPAGLSGCRGGRSRWNSERCLLRQELRCSGRGAGGPGGRSEHPRGSAQFHWALGFLELRPSRLCHRVPLAQPGAFGCEISCRWNEKKKKTLGALGASTALSKSPGGELGLATGLCQERWKETPPESCPLLWEGLRAEPAPVLAGKERSRRGGEGQARPWPGQLRPPGCGTNLQLPGPPEVSAPRRPGRCPVAAPH